MNTKRQSYFFYYRLAILFVFGALLWFAPRPAYAAAPPPQHRPVTNDCYMDNIYYGAIPPGGENSPVLVFVHGYGGLATDWWANVPGLLVNDTYDLAYAAGYRTAFVDLSFDKRTCVVERKPAKQMIVNGYALSAQIEEIRAHYHVDQVDIIAHSKGGIDAQAALVYWNAWRYVRNVFTFGTPHQGSLLADLLWSPEGGWVAAFLGDRDTANFSMQTSVMQTFRMTTDPRTVDDQTDYYIGAGNVWDTPDTSFPITGKYLQEHPFGGDNDGVVTVSSTSLFNSKELFLQPWNHEDLLVGHNFFPYAHSILLEEPADTVGLLLQVPAVGYVGHVVEFSARAPLTSTTPVTYTWQAIGQNEVVVTSGITSSVSFVWDQPGDKLVTVTATSANGTHTKSQSVRIETVIPPANLAVTGPITAQVNTSYSFAAAVPPSTTVPLLYTWQATDQPDLVTVGTIGDTEIFLWNTEGTKVITVMATNAGGSMTAVHVVEVGPALPPARLTLTGLSAGQVGLGYRFTANVPDTAVTPIIYTWEATDQAGVLKTGGLEDSVVYTWQNPGEKTIRLSAANEEGEISVSSVISIAAATAGGSDASTLFLPFATYGPISGIEPIRAAALAQVQEEQQTALPANYILRGGSVDGAAEATVAIEPEATALDFSLITTDPDVSAVLVGPDGSRYPMALDDAELFGLLAGAYLSTQQLNGPAPGSWSLQLSSPRPAGYLLIATVDSALQLQVAGLPEDTILTPQQPIQLHVNGAETADAVSIDQISASFATGGSDVQSAESSVSASSLLSIVAPPQEGFHTLSVSVKGQTASGHAFERTLVRSLAVISDRADLNLPQFLQRLLDTIDDTEE